MRGVHAGQPPPRRRVLRPPWACGVQRLAAAYGRPGQAVTTEPSRFVQGALVAGQASHVLSRVLKSPNVAQLIRSLPVPLRSEVESTCGAIHRAAAEWESLPVSLERSSETGSGEIGSGLGDGFGVIEWLSTEQAANLLGLSHRRLQQLGAGGMGHMVGGTWRFDPTSVRSYMDRRGDGAGAA